VLATGCRERPRAARLVPGARPFGVFTTGTLQQLVALEHARVGRRAVVVGAEHVSFSAVVTLAHGGARTVAMVTDQPRHQSYAVLAALTAGVRRVPILNSSAVTDVIGGARLEAVEVTHRPTGTVRRIACDTLVFTGDWIPDHELARTGGLMMDPATRAPRVDGALRTSAHGVFAAGNLVHAAETADIAALTGRHAANAAAAFLTSGEWPRRPPVPLVCRAPVRWISPSAVDPGTPRVPRDRFLLRVDEFRRDAQLEVRQADRVLWRRRYRRLVPACAIHADASWIRRVDTEAGEITVGLAG
jgi:pyruvate/2-oxoglutarate dehydrogenase complex dihydrolipoamide dehydrogenase (E3) component